jgi:hypothetical protein
VNLVSRVSEFGRRRLVALFIGPVALALAVASPVAFASQASAATTVPVAMTLNEPKQFDLVSGCAVFLAFEGLCGSGVAVPYGHATETIDSLPCGERGVHARIFVPFGSYSGSLAISPLTHVPKISTSTGVPTAAVDGTYAYAIDFPTV